MERLIGLIDVLPIQQEEAGRGSWAFARVGSLAGGRYHALCRQSVCCGHVVTRSVAGLVHLVRISLVIIGKIIYNDDYFIIITINNTALRVLLLLHASVLLSKVLLVAAAADRIPVNDNGIIGIIGITTTTTSNNSRKPQQQKAASRAATQHNAYNTYNMRIEHTSTTCT